MAFANSGGEGDRLGDRCSCLFWQSLQHWCVCIREVSMIKQRKKNGSKDEGPRAIPNVPGAMVRTRIPRGANSLAIGSVLLFNTLVSSQATSLAGLVLLSTLLFYLHIHSNNSCFARRVCRLSLLSVSGRNTSGVDKHSSLAFYMSQ